MNTIQLSCAVVGIWFNLLVVESGNGIHKLQQGFETKIIKLTTGSELEYVEKGEKKGKKIIFLHGFSDSWHSFENVLRLMPDRIHSIAITQRGHGNSSKPDTGYHLQDFAKDLADFIRMKNLGPCIVAGHSLCGLVAQQFPLDYPELTKALIIISSDACFRDNPGIPELRDEIMNLNAPADYSFAEAFQKSTIVNQVDSASLELGITESMKLSPHVWHQVMEGIYLADFTEQLSSIKAEVLIFWGTKDTICFREDQQKFTQHLKKFSFIKYEGTGHAIHWEEPDRFVTDIVNFINSKS